MSPPQVLYIAGNGHSGSTLLGMALSNSSDQVFFAGELTNLSRDSIFDEYCSCHSKIQNCPVWTRILQQWESNRAISFEEFKRLRQKFEPQKSTLTMLKNKLWPGAEFKAYGRALLRLLQAIQETTGASLIIDSSKNAQRIAVLDQVTDLRVIHLCRNFKGVLNSAKRNYKKDIKRGIEKDNPPRRTSITLRDWLLNNALCEFYTIGVRSEKLGYSDFVNDPKKMENLFGRATLEFDLDKPIRPDHVLAGNIIRLENELFLNPNVGFQYKRLSPRQMRLAKIIDFVFRFWR